MIDIHSHILFNVDDGPGIFQQSIDMLEAATKEGISDIISTSHTCHPQYHVSAELVKLQVHELQNELHRRHIPLSIHLGHEVRLCEDIINLVKEKEILSLADSNYLLLELPSNHIPRYTKNIIHELHKIGIIPIIAHPERNKAIAQKPERLERLIREGAAAQITAGSIVGHFGRTIQKLSMELMKANLVHTYGSDAHHVKRRPFLFKQGLFYLEKHKLLDLVDLFMENNKRIIGNDSLIMYEPDVSSKKKRSLFTF
ncbi:tyrosine-protein phosphatase [Ureibacillus sp. 179-F W5.1 NHS]|uniref:tyrosine-protein phosphatase n=1 Tax=Ureibacillus sp. 179-F W5.1 NHS TaxID=3374297 RepID=UPI0038790D24